MFSLLLSLACVAPPTADAPADPWLTEISARTRAQGQAFTSSADGLVSPSPALAAELSIQSDGVELAGTEGADSWGVRLTTRRVGWVDGVATDVGERPPTLGRCIPGATPALDGSCLPRAELRSAGVVEFWAPRGHGYEQGFDLERPAGGEGRLFVDIGVQGARVATDGRTARLILPDGRTLKYDGLKVSDAGGGELASSFEARSDGVRIVVNTEGARFPVTIDPTLAPAWYGEIASGDAVSDVAGVGDVNGDGYDDVVLGVAGYDNGSTNEGGLFLYYGSVDGPDTTADWSYDPGSSSAGLGYSVSGIGDVNGDGYADFVGGASGYTSSYSSEGAVYAFYGSASGPGSTYSFRSAGGQSGAYLGHSVGGGGDVNGDGYDDLVAGAYGYANGSTAEGAVYYWYGSASGLVSTIRRLEVNQTSAYLGRAVALVGDVNGDGYADIAGAAPNYDDGQTDEGEVFVWHGAAAGPSATASWSVDSDQTSGGLGSSVTGAGDVNGDGYNDLAVGATGYDNGHTSEGKVWVYHGSASGLASSAAWTFEPDATSAFAGNALIGPGDIDDDGYDDLAVASYGEARVGTTSGTVRIFSGSSTGLATTASSTVDGPENAAYFGTSLGGGDIDGDGFVDVLVGGNLARAWMLVGGPDGATRRSPTVATLASTVTYFGAEIAAGGADFDADGYDDVAIGSASSAIVSWFGGTADGIDTTVAGTYAGGSSFGTVISASGDTNGDGYDDLLIGGYTSYSSSRGAVYLKSGSASGLSTAVGTIFSGASTSMYLGASVAILSDVNGDGYDEVAAGTTQYDNGQTNEGAVVVYHGSASGPSTTATITLESNVDSAYFGVAVAAAGDVDGDGFGELLAGAYNYEDTLAGEGAAFVYLGATGGLSSTADWSVVGGVRNVQCGYGVTGLGDVDADGYDDFAVGCPGYSATLTNEGRVMAFYGSSTGPATAPDWTVDGGEASAALGSPIRKGGDFDDDGFDDFAVGSGLLDVNVDGDGAAMVFLGGVTGLASSPEFTLTSDVPDRYYGAEVGSAGDLDNDGRDELLVTAYQAERAYVYSLTDGDGDGYYAWEDCDDADADVSPAESELCDGLDNDCDGHIDESIPTWYPDADSDGYGAATGGTAACTGPSGYVASSTDCDDTDAAVNPGASETCNATDDDCDSSIDEAGATDGTLYYRDADGDSYGALATTERYCTVTAGWVSLSTDCDDSDATAYPGASETCDGTDDDCDGTTDEASAIDAPTWYTDADGDGYGSTALTMVACSASSAWSALSTDCDDTSGFVHPGVLETCNSVDDDCDGGTDEGVTTTWYADADVDGYGDAAIATDSCSAPTGYVGDDTDCDDADATVNPGESETCNSVDDDCDGTADEGVTTNYYYDGDGDGYGLSSSAVANCSLPSGYAAASGDCDDADATVSPGATESCNDADDDCDGVSDDGIATTAWYIDADGDSFGGTASVADCAAPTGYVGGADDCDDTDATVLDGRAWYADLDGDRYGDAANGAWTCEADAGYVADDRDCDDTRDDVHPYAPDEAYDGLDADCKEDSDYDADGDGHDSDAYGGDDCDDEDAEAFPGGTEYAYDGIDGDCAGDSDYDADGDGYDSVESGGDDCDDADAEVNPGAANDPYDGEATSCDPAAEYDADGDGERIEGGGGFDCDDADASIHTDADEVWYDGIDQDCDGNDSDQDGDGVPSGEDCADTDPEVTGGCSDTGDTGDTGEPNLLDELFKEGCGCASGAASPLWLAGLGVVAALRRRGRVAAAGTAIVGSILGCGGFVDADGDGFVGDEDCDDADATIHPGGGERCDDSKLDEDCDGKRDDDDDDVTDPTTYFRDQDEDGHGDPDNHDPSCKPGEGFVAAGDDCDDEAPGVFPGSVEVCGGIDEDCDELIDEDDPNLSDPTLWYADDDGDGFGGGAAVPRCDSDGGDYVDVGGDCDDSDADINPDAKETCDTRDIDEDCDGAADDLDDGSTVGATSWYTDADGDGYAGTEYARTGCDAEFGQVEEAGDCNDSNSDINPSRREVCGDRIDQDCDGTADGCALDGTIPVEDAYALIYSVESADQLGWKLATGGDSDGDGVPEAWVADRLAPAGSGYGAALLIAGLPVGVGSVDDFGLLGVHAEAEDDMVNGIWSRGDLDGDGLDDLVVSSYESDTAGSNRGYSYVFLAPFEREHQEDDAWAERYGALNSEYGGYSVITLDYDDDGADDLLWAKSNGDTYLEFGPITAGPSTATAADDVFIDLSSGSIWASGDVNGDGVDELFAGQPGYGDLYQFDGGTTGTSLDASDATGGVNTTRSYFGWAVDVSSDLDGDGDVDITIGAPNDAGGYAYVHFGPLDGAETITEFDVTITGTYTDGLLGYSLAGGGDVNQDGEHDLLVGAPDAAVGGGAWLFTGPLVAGALDDTTGCAAVFSDTSVDAGIGGSVGLIDLDNDGLAEVLTGGALLSGYGGGGVGIYSPEGL